MLELFLAALVLVGCMLLACGFKGHGGPFYAFFKIFSITLLGVGFLSALTPHVFHGMVLLLVGWCVVGAGLTVYFTFFRSPQNGAQPLSKQHRVLCVVFGLTCILAYPLETQRPEIAKWLSRRALVEGKSSTLATVLDGRVQPWNSLAQLPPSPQRDQLARMAVCGAPPEQFWELLFSLPPSPQRTAVVRAFSEDTRGKGEMFIAMYGQGDSATADVLLEADSTPSAYDRYSPTHRLMSALVSLERVDALRYLLTRPGAYFSSDALSTAIEKGHAEMVALLLDKRPPDQNLYFSPLLLAARHGHKPLIPVLLARGFDLTVDCALEGAIKDPDMVAFLLEQGASPRCPEKGDSPLHTALYYDVDIRVIRMLLEAGADIHASRGGEIPLQVAVHYDNTPAFDALLEAGAEADLGIVDSYGATLLHVAARKGRHSILSRLMTLRPDLADVKDNAGKFAADYANDAKTLEILCGGRKN